MNGTAQWRRPGAIAGLAASLALHAWLIFGYRLGMPDQPAEPPARALTVWLQPPKPPATVATIEPPPPPPKPIQPRKREKTDALARRKGDSQSQPAPAASAAQTITLPAPATTPTPAPDPLNPDPQPKKFDMNAALKTARKVATEKGALQDPARAGTAVAQLDDHPLYPEQNTSELARKIDAAKRPDCKNGNGAGLLSPLIWLMDKKDHGCKW